MSRKYVSPQGQILSLPQRHWGLHLGLHTRKPKTGEVAENLRNSGRKLPCSTAESTQTNVSGGTGAFVGVVQRRFWWNQNQKTTSTEGDFEVLIQQSSQVHHSDHPLITGLCNRILIISLCIIIYQQLGGVEFSLLEQPHDCLHT